MAMSTFLWTLERCNLEDPLAIHKPQHDVNGSALARPSLKPLRPPHALTTDAWLSSLQFLWPPGILVEPDTQEATSRNGFWSEHRQDQDMEDRVS